MCRTGGRRCHGKSTSRVAARERQRRSRAARHAAEATRLADHDNAPSNPTTATADTGGDVTTKKPQAKRRHEVEDYEGHQGQVRRSQNEATREWIATPLPGLYTPPTTNPIDDTAARSVPKSGVGNGNGHTEGDVTPTPTAGMQTNGLRVTNWAAPGAQVGLQSTGHVTGQTVVMNGSDGGRDIAAHAKRAAETAMKSDSTGDVTTGPVQGVVGIQAPHVHNSRVYRTNLPTDQAGGLESRIRNAYEELSVKQQDWVRLSKLREKLGNPDKAEMDRVLRAMARTGRVHLAPSSNRKALTAADHAAAHRIGSEDKHLIAIEPPDDSCNDTGSDR